MSPQISLQTGVNEVQAAPPAPSLGSTWAHGTWNNPKESQRQYHELTEISFPTTWLNRGSI